MKGWSLQDLTCLVIVFKTQSVSFALTFLLLRGRCRCFPGAGAQEKRVQREDDRGGDLRGGEALPEGPAGEGQQAVHSVHRPAASEGGGVWAGAGTHVVDVFESPLFHRSASVLMVLMVRAGHSTKLLTPLACSPSFLNTHRFSENN